MKVKQNKKKHDVQAEAGQKHKHEQPNKTSYQLVPRVVEKVFQLIQSHRIRIYKLQVSVWELSTAWGVLRIVTVLKEALRTER